MSNLVAFKNVVRRAEDKARNQICLIENMPITTNAGIIMFANQHINKLEEQLISAYANSVKIEKEGLAEIERLNKIIATMNRVAETNGFKFDMQQIVSTIE